ncbi:MAG: Rrf2 family transcriptional regulator [bacterium]|nr:Rrf2 family transcriptional regulator [bacterium]
MNSEFALAVHSLVLLAYDPGTMLTSTNISESVSVHPVRVRKILSLLKKSGYIDSKEGAKGGFLIDCDPNNVTLDEIYLLTVKDVLKPKCHTCPTTCTVGSNIEGVLNEIFVDADKNLQNYLAGFTLEMLLEKMRSK